MNGKTFNEPLCIESALNRGCLTQDRLPTDLSAAIEAIFKAMECLDPYTVSHQKRVASIAKAIGRQLDWDYERIQALYLAALVHDIGKMKVPLEILTKAAPLTDLEVQIVQSHAEAGYQILKDIPNALPIAQIVHQHHERLDGSGYPNGLLSDQICEEAKVIAVADTFEAMANSRPYRQAKGLTAALDEIKAEAGIKLDLKAVEAIFQLLATGNELQKIIDSQ